MKASSSDLVLKKAEEILALSRIAPLSQAEREFIKSLFKKVESYRLEEKPRGREDG